MSAVAAHVRPYQPRPQQNTPAAFALAVAMHGLLVLALWISVQWRVEPAGPVVVELWGAPPEPAVVAPPPPPPPPVQVEREPEKPDADIVVKQEKKPPPPDPKKLEAQRRLEEERRLEAERKLEAEKKRREAEAKRLAEEKKQLEAERKKQAEAMARAEQLRREEERREAVRKAEEERMLKQAGSGGPVASAAAGSGRGDAGYGAQLNAVIRPRIVFAVPENTPQSVYAEFQVDLLPTGEILSVRKLKASGLAGYDEAVERAIRRTDPFPRKRDGTVDRTVIIRFRPVDAQ